MAHRQESTYSYTDAEKVNEAVSRAWGSGLFVRADSETQITVQGDTAQLAEFHESTPNETEAEPTTTAAPVTE